MNRLIKMSLVMFLACHSRHSSTDIVELERVEHDDASFSDETVQENGDTFVIEYGGPKIAPEGPSELFLRGTFQTMSTWGIVVCTLAEKTGIIVQVTAGYARGIALTLFTSVLTPSSCHQVQTLIGTKAERSFPGPLLMRYYRPPRISQKSKG